jgi:hypothetical protein
VYKASLSLRSVDYGSNSIYLVQPAAPKTATVMPYITYRPNTIKVGLFVTTRLLSFLSYHNQYAKALQSAYLKKYSIYRHVQFIQAYIRIQ